MKGFIPVQMYLRGTEFDSCGIEMVLIIIALVMGHIFPVLVLAFMFLLQLRN